MNYDEELKTKKHTEQEKKGKSPKSGDVAFNWLFSYFFLFLLLVLILLFLLLPLLFHHCSHKKEGMVGI